MTRYFVNKSIGILHIEGMCKESTLRPYDVELFENEEEIKGRYHRLCKGCERKRRRLQANDTNGKDWWS